MKYMVESTRVLLILSILLDIVVILDITITQTHFLCRLFSLSRAVFSRFFESVLFSDQTGGGW